MLFLQVLCGIALVFAEMPLAFLRGRKLKTLDALKEQAQLVCQLFEAMYEDVHTPVGACFIVGERAYGYGDFDVRMTERHEVSVSPQRRTCVKKAE